MPSARNACRPIISRVAGRTLKWEYGLRPDLLAVTNVWEQAGSAELIVAAKGAPEAIAELCHLPEPERAAIARRGRRDGARGHARARRRAGVCTR